MSFLLNLSGDGLEALIFLCVERKIRFAFLEPILEEDGRVLH